MLRFLFRLFVGVLVILFAFAVVPDSFWNWLKPYFNVSSFGGTLGTGFTKFSQFLREATGLDLSQVPEKFRQWLGIDLSLIWERGRDFFATIFEKLSNFFRRQN